MDHHAHDTARIYAYLWSFDVKRGHETQFEQIYGAQGEWVQLFEHAAGYLRTELHRDRQQPNRYVTIDYWRSQAAYENFRAQSAVAFAQLDSRCADLTEREELIGAFDCLSCPLSA